MSSDLIIFFLTFNPIVISLLVNISYTHISNLRRDLFHIRRIMPKTGPPLPEKLFVNVSEYCDITDKWLFSALLFWILGTFVGGVTLAYFMEKTQIDLNSFLRLLSSCPQQLIPIGFLVNFGFHLWITFSILRSKLLEWWDLPFASYRFRNILRCIIVRRFIFHLLYVVFPIWYTYEIVPRAYKLNDNFECLFADMIFVSIGYLIVWAFLGLFYTPLTSLEKLREHV